MKIAIVKIQGCFNQTINGGIGGCPYKRSYGVEPGCVFRYGELPKEGFPVWCPLSKIDAFYNEIPIP